MRASSDIPIIVNTIGTNLPLLAADFCVQEFLLDLVLQDLALLFLENPRLQYLRLLFVFHLKLVPLIRNHFLEVGVFEDDRFQAASGCVQGLQVLLQNDLRLV